MGTGAPQYQHQFQRENQGRLRSCWHIHRNMKKYRGRSVLRVTLRIPRAPCKDIRRLLVSWIKLQASPLTPHTSHLLSSELFLRPIPFSSVLQSLSHLHPLSFGPLEDLFNPGAGSLRPGRADRSTAPTCQKADLQETSTSTVP